MLLREYFAALGVCPKKWWYVTAFPPLFVALYTTAVLLGSKWPTDIRIATYHYPSGWVWASACLLSLAILQFWAWREEYQKRRGIERTAEQQISTAADAHKTAVESIQRDLDAIRQISSVQIAGLESRLADALLKIGRPVVTLTYSEVQWQDSYLAGAPITYQDRTEFLATCSGADAFGVFFQRTLLGETADGEYYLQSRIEADKIPAGQSKKLEYTLLYGPTGNQSVSVQFIGRLQLLLGLILRYGGGDSLSIPIGLGYKDSHGSIHESPSMQLFYHPCVPGTPLIRIAGPKAACSAIRQ